MKAIETSYKGYRFRSRLEARWAVFLDALGLGWDYEKEGFYLGEVAYLPDFFVRNLQFWLEIKPEQPNEEERKKCRLLAERTKQPVFIMIGIPEQSSNGVINAEGYRRRELSFDEKVAILTGIESEGDAAICYDIIRESLEVRRADPLTFRDCFGSDRDYSQAIIAARSARFEHGETPTVKPQPAVTPSPLFPQLPSALGTMFCSQLAKGCPFEIPEPNVIVFKFRDEGAFRFCSHVERVDRLGKAISKIMGASWQARLELAARS